MGAVGVTLVVPWKPDGSVRSRNWEWVHARWKALYPTWEIAVVAMPAGRFNTAAAVNHGAERAAGRIVVVAYADIAVDDAWMLDAVETVDDGATVAAPAVQCRLGRFESYDLLRLPPEMPLPDLDPHADGIERRDLWPGIAVTTRRHLLDHPFDEGFTGWGYAGEAWMAATAALGGRVARSGHAWHLWHPAPPSETWRADGAADGRALFDIYHRAIAAGDLDRVRALAVGGRRA